jgi:pyruvate/2-oxoglutarate/acetoin dehydrogenase E1 component
MTQCGIDWRDIGLYGGLWSNSGIVAGFGDERIRNTPFEAAIVGVVSVRR